MGQFDNPRRKMTTETIRWYRSKVDWWLAMVLCLPPIASVAVCLGLALGEKSSELPWGIAAAALVVAVYGGLVFPMRYGVDGTHLTVRFGLCRRRIPLVDITEVYPTHNPLSSPALSLDRLHVQFGSGFLKAIMISPFHRHGFLDDLAHAASLKRQGELLVRL